MHIGYYYQFESIGTASDDGFGEDMLGGQAVIIMTIVKFVEKRKQSHSDIGRAASDIHDVLA
jgi:hypothetical protein